MEEGDTMSEFVLFCIFCACVLGWFDGGKKIKNYDQ